MLLQYITSFDKKISGSLYSLGKNYYIVLILNVLTKGYGVVPLIFLLLLLFNLNSEIVLIILLTLIIGIINDFAVKRLIKRERPIYSDKISYAFPSTHAVASTFILLYLIANIRNDLYLPVLPPTLLYFALNSFSRIYLGHHYIGDVIAGILFGSALFLTFYLI